MTALSKIKLHRPPLWRSSSSQILVRSGQCQMQEASGLVGQRNVAKNPNPIIIEKIGFDDNYIENDYKCHYNQIFFAAANHNLNKIWFIIISDVIIIKNGLFDYNWVGVFCDKLERWIGAHMSGGDIRTTLLE